MIDRLNSNVNFMQNSYNAYSYARNELEENSIFLEEKLESIKDKQGLLGKTWNGIKELTTLGVSESDCENMLDKYNKGEISFEEAVSYLDDFDSKQKTMSNLLSNIATGVGAIAFATATAGTGLGFVASFKAGAPIGAALKTGINFLDRATNDVDNDAFDIKEMAKDAISGAMTGTTSAVASGVGTGIRNGNITTSILNGAKCGAICGSMSGALDYTTNAIFDNEKFNFENLISNTLLSGATSATVGAVVGGSMYGGASLLGSAGHEVTKTTSEIITQDCASSTARKILGTEVKQAINA